MRCSGRLAIPVTFSFPPAVTPFHLSLRCSPPLILVVNPIFRGDLSRFFFPPARNTHVVFSSHFFLSYGCFHNKALPPFLSFTTLSRVPMTFLFCSRNNSLGLVFYVLVFLARLSLVTPPPQRPAACFLLPPRVDSPNAHW